jgi:hypothetical protein
MRFLAADSSRIITRLLAILFWSNTAVGCSRYYIRQQSARTEPLNVT